MILFNDNIECDIVIRIETIFFVMFNTYNVVFINMTYS